MHGCNRAVVDEVLRQLQQVDPHLAAQMNGRVQMQLQGVGAYDPHAHAVVSDELFKAVQRAGHGAIIDRVLQQIQCPTAMVTRVRTHTAVPDASVGAHPPGLRRADGIYRGY